jgi:hypothetical protein
MRRERLAVNAEVVWQQQQKKKKRRRKHSSRWEVSTRSRKESWEEVACASIGKKKRYKVTYSLSCISDRSTGSYMVARGQAAHCTHFSHAEEQAQITIAVRFTLRR